MRELYAHMIKVEVDYLHRNVFDITQEELLSLLESIKLHRVIVDNYDAFDNMEGENP